MTFLQLTWKHTLQDYYRPHTKYGVCYQGGLVRYQVRCHGIYTLHGTGTGTGTGTGNGTRSGGYCARHWDRELEKYYVYFYTISGTEKWIGTDKWVQNPFENCQVPVPVPVQCVQYTLSSPGPCPGPSSLQCVYAIRPSAKSGGGGAPVPNFFRGCGGA